MRVNAVSESKWDLERKSSAITLSDMEIFVFPELMYSLVLANIMSPKIWRWREDSWFKGVAKMKPYRRVLRLKQFIMDHYIFNLDLDTWGVTTKQRELDRFKEFIDLDILRQSNSLFGYEGDRYYFDIDIRSHFGLDKYDSEVIPYWKTETVEAMDAFRFKDHYQSGAGECVSLAALYAAALFVVAGIPLKDIFMMATPLHSQNFIDIDDGILTNNRRLVTKTMWFNGTALSAQARRALENERITVVAHETGYIHVLYPEATMDPMAYGRFSAKLRQFLQIPLSDEMLGNFLRHSPEYQRCFQIRWPIHGVDHYIGAERVFAYEQDSSSRLTDDTRSSLMADIDVEEFRPIRMPGGIVLNDLEAYIRKEKIDLNQAADVDRLRQQFTSDCLNAARAIESLIRFCHVDPKLPDAVKKTVVTGGDPLNLSPEMNREAIKARLELLRATNPVADLAFYAYRDLNRTDAGPFLKAAVERNPVSIKGVESMSEEQFVQRAQAMPDESIYDEPGRMAQPDEVWNYGRGDGAEKVVLLANLIKNRDPCRKMAIDVQPDRVTLWADAVSYPFLSRKALRSQKWMI